MKCLSVDNPLPQKKGKRCCMEVSVGISNTFNCFHFFSVNSFLL